MAIIMVGKINKPIAGYRSDPVLYDQYLFAGASLFWTGISVGKTIYIYTIYTYLLLLILYIY